MKKLIVLISLVFLLSIIFTACNKDSANGERTVRNVLTAYYSVNQSDYDYYKKMTKGATDSEFADFNKSYETNSKKFEQYLSDKSYNDFYNSRVSYLRIEKAYKNNVFVEIKNLTITKEREDKKEKTIGYDYKLQLKQTNKDTKKTNIVTKNGTMTVINKDGHWKVVDIIS